MSEFQNDEIIFIIDIGAYETTIGIAGNSASIEKIPTILANSSESLIKNSHGIVLNNLAEEITYGVHAKEYQNTLRLKPFLQEKDYLSLIFLIKDWLQSKELATQDLNIILVFPSYFSLFEQRKILKLFFNIIQVKRIASIPFAATILASISLHTATIIDIGQYSSRIEGIFHGYPKIESSQIYPIGGAHITQYLTEYCQNILKFSEIEPLEGIFDLKKRELVLIENNPEHCIELISAGIKKFDYTINLPTEDSLIFNKERIFAGEIFFNPGILKIFTDPLDKLIVKSIRSWERDQIYAMCENIVICGNGGNFPNLKEKILSKIQTQFPDSLCFNLIEIEDNKMISWKGAEKILNSSHNTIKWYQSKEEIV